MDVIIVMTMRYKILNYKENIFLTDKEIYSNYTENTFLTDKEIYSNYKENPFLTDKEVYSNYKENTFLTGLSRASPQHIRLPGKSDRSKYNDL